jgi:hypothetical protein
MPMSRPLSVLEPNRIRFVPPSFAWIDRRLRERGLLASLSADEIALYVFLVLAADREGLSCWRVDRMARELPLESAEIVRARKGLVDKGLIAFRSWGRRGVDGSYQMLSIEVAAIPVVRRGGIRSMRDVLDASIEA